MCVCVCVSCWPVSLPQHGRKVCVMLCIPSLLLCYNDLLSVELNLLMLNYCTTDVHCPLFDSSLLIPTFAFKCVAHCFRQLSVVVCMHFGVTRTSRERAHL